MGSGVPLQWVVGGGSRCNEVWELWGFGVWGPTDGILLPPPQAFRAIRSFLEHLEAAAESGGGTEGGEKSEGG